MPPQLASGLDAFVEDVAAFVRVLWAHKLSIASIVALFVAAALAFIVLSTPLYLSRTQLLIDPRSKRVLQTEVVPTGLGQSSNGADVLLVDSQVEIIGSDAILRGVIKTAGLAKDPEFLAVPGAGPIGFLREMVAGITGYRRPDVAPDEAVLERLRRLLYVKRVGNTYIIEVGAFSRDQAKAARIANAVAQTYLADQASATSQSTRETTEALVARLALLRRNLTEAEDKVEDYRRANSLIGTQGVLIDEQRLQDLNARLGLARTRTEEAQSRLDQAQRLVREGTASAASAEGLDTPALSDLRTSLAEIERNLASANEQFGNRHPTVRSLQAQRTAIKQQIDTELKLAVQRARSALDLARQNEAALSTELERLKRTSLANNDAQIKLRELQRDAESSRAVFEAVLIRAKQSSEQEDLPSANYRILSPAVPAIRIAYPPAPIVLLGALAAGLFFGCVTAWLRDRFSRVRLPTERGLA